MGRPEGLEKTGGRKSGTPNKKTEEITELLEKLNCDPITNLVKITEDERVDVGIKTKIFINFWFIG